ncbi:MAG: nucleoside hydrolase [Anaerolineae bacterium]|nr:nucleoside hydrolase [Anaerolineae bacterium]
MQKILLDTDIGYDIDDAVCLAYLLMQPQCDLLGITTVTGEAENRARIASALCQAAGRDVPIFPGAEEPLIIPQRQVAAPQAQALEDLPHQHYFPLGEAVLFLRDTIRSHPGEITLLAIGPLTNIALLFAIDPQIPMLLKSLVMMGGAFRTRTPYVEWNMSLDPHAAAMVYRTELPQHRTVGLNVTGVVGMPAAQVRRHFQRGLLATVLKLAEVYFTQRDDIIFHDPLAAATLFDERLCTFDCGTVSVEVNHPELAGLTYWQPDRFGRHEVATQVQPRRFFEHYLGVFQQHPEPHP